MMLSRKPGPPVPPRPSAVVVANALAKSRTNSPTEQSTMSSPGRTVVYKSPSVNDKKPDFSQEIKLPAKATKNLDDSSLDQHNNHHHSLIGQASNVCGMTSEHKNDVNKIVIVNGGQNISDTNEVIKQNENLKPIQLEIYTKSPMARAKYHGNNNYNISSDENFTLNNANANANANEIIRGLSTVASCTTTSTPTTVSHLLNGVTNDYNYLKYVNNKNNNPSDCTTNGNNNEDMNENHHNSSDSNLINSLEQNDIVVINGNTIKEQTTNCIAIKTATNNTLKEHEKNVKNSAPSSPISLYDEDERKIFTGIIINNEPNKGAAAQCISVRRTPSPPANLKYRPEPEGGETNQIKDCGPQLKSGFLKPLEDRITVEKKVAFHELLISELTAMRRDADENNAILEPRKKRYPSDVSMDLSPNGTQRSRIRTADWVEVGDNGKEVVFSSCHISLEDSGLEDEEKLDDTSSGVGDSWDSTRDNEERISMSLPGLPPLPKSLSGFELTAAQQHHHHQLLLQQHQHNNSQIGVNAALDTQRGVSPLARKSTLDTQLAILRREMFGLRQLDLSLLSQLWALNESIQEFRSMLQEQETLSPPSPSPSPSDANSLSSGDEDEPPLEAPIPRMRTAPPPPPNRKAPSRPV